MTDRRFIARFVLVTAALCLFMGGVGARLAYLHLSSDANTRERKERRRVYRKEIVAGRGQILEGSAVHNILALNLAARDVCADPAVILEQGDLAPAAARLACLLDLDPEFVLSRLDRPDRRFEYIRRFVPEPLARSVQAMGMKGLFFQDTYCRRYPHGTFMCHVLGFANHEGVGSAGIEQTMDRFLRGSPGLLVGKVDARSHELYVRRVREVEPQTGATVYLTIDQNIQYMAEKALLKAVAEHQAQGGWTIVQQVRTGEILAMVSWPGYDPNDFQRASTNGMLNRAIGYVYEPGSTLKPFTVAAALNEGTVTPATVFDCENGCWIHCRRPLRDSHPYGELTVADIIKKSSNIGAAKVALSLGEDRLHRYLTAFGFGSGLGIDLPGEESGILHPLSRWSRISASRIAIGQGIGVTALQVLNAFSAIANDGRLMRPHVVESVVAPDGRVLYRAQPELLSEPVRPETARTMRELLARVTEDGGTGRRARVPGCPVAGKTGTAQKPVGGGYSDTLYMASFVGFFPVVMPEVAMVVVLDSPQPRHTGGYVAAPVFGEIGEQLVRYMDISAAEPILASAGGL